jgi:hypothetical protein
LKSLPHKTLKRLDDPDHREGVEFAVFEQGLADAVAVGFFDIPEGDSDVLAAGGAAVAMPNAVIKVGCINP